MPDHTLTRRLALFAAALLVAGCSNEPTLPASRLTPRAPRASIAPPAGTNPFYQQSIWRIVDENDNEIWQNVADAPLSGGYFTLAEAPAVGDFAPCGLFQQGSFKTFGCSLVPGLFWEFSLLSTSRTCQDQVYPVAMWVWANPTCFALAYNPTTAEGFSGHRFQVTAAPTAPGGLVFKRWELTIGGDLLPCAEGANSPTCTVTLAHDYPGVGLFYKLVYGVQFPFTGFFSPVDNPPVWNGVKAGTAVPVKFSLGSDRGLGILASGSPTSVQVACDVSATSDDIEATATPGGSSLTYDAATDQYTYVWKTDKAWPNTCREFRLTLTDGSVHVAEFKFKK